MTQTQIITGLSAKTDGSENNPHRPAAVMRMLKKMKGRYLPYLVILPRSISHPSKGSLIASNRRANISRPLPSMAPHCPMPA